MNTRLAVPPQFEVVRDQDETILWVGRPRFLVFILGGVPFLMMGLVWGAIDYFGFIRHMPSQMIGFAIPFFALHLMPLWLSVLNFARLILVHRNTFYAFSDRRVMIRSGFWGTDFRTIDYDRISEVEVNVNPVENLLGVGSIVIDSGRRGRPVGDAFVGIEKPYEVFKRLKEVAVDIKTDWNYPNALRPATNPGYATEYVER